VAGHPIRRWLLVTVPLIAVVAGVFAFDVPRLIAERRVVAAHRALLRAASGRRSFKSRLVGSAYGPVVSRRGGGTDTLELSPEVNMAAASIERTARDTLTPAALASLGSARLITGNTAGAVRALEASVHAGEDARNLSDLAAAYLARVDESHRVEDLARALEAAERATAMQADLPEALFNRALALEGAGLREQARAAWTKCLDVDRDGPWATEAREHQAGLAAHVERWEDWIRATGLQPDHRFADEVLLEGARRFAQPMREWVEQDAAVAWSRATEEHDERRRNTVAAMADAVGAALSAATADRMAEDAAGAYRTTPKRERLAAANVAYAEGLARYRRHERASAGEQYAIAERAFLDAGSVQWMWAAVQKAVVDYQLRDLEAARAALTRVERASRELPYPIVRARVAWLSGLIDMQQGRLAQAIPSYRAAAVAFERAGELENAGHVYNTWADTLRILGDYQEGWRTLGRALVLSPSFREPIRRYLVFFNASLYARREGLLHASLLFENGAVEQAELDRESPAAQVEARLRRAALFGELSRTGDSTADLIFAGDQLSHVKDATQAAYFNATKQAVEVEVFADRATAVRDADAALPVLERAEPAEVPRLLLARARAQRYRRNWDDAEDSLSRAIDAFEHRRRSLTASDDRIAYLDHGIALYRELAGIRLDRGADSGEAFAVLERGRARTLFEDLGSTAAVPRAIREIQGRLPSDVTIVVYSVLRERLLTWVIARNHVFFDDRPVLDTEIASRVEALQTVLDLGASTPQVVQAAGALQALLIQPWIAKVAPRTRLVFVPDGPLHRVPFALLPTTNGRWLGADHAIALSPSASLYVRDSKEAPRTSPPARPLLIGDWLPPGDAGSGLAALPDSGNEVREIARLYPAADVLVQRDATVTAFRRHIPLASLVHFAGHAVVDSYAPQLSRLVFTPEPGQTEAGFLYASDIARLDLAHVHVVVLAACDTADGPVRTGEGVISMARAFLSAGAPTVVATLWKIDDRAARTAFVSLHRGIRDGLSVDEALRRTQAAMQSSDDRLLRDPRQWAGLVVVKVGSTRKEEGD
jgi:CHAT domain-containing protein/tetratricopeptide (TPR) repeat protein